MAAPFRYNNLGYVALTVTQLNRSVAFYRDLVGLDVVEQNETAAFLRCGKEHHHLVLYQGASAGLKRIGFQLETAADLEKAFKHFSALGLRPEYLHLSEQQALKQGPSFRVREPHSKLELEYFQAATHIARPFTPSVAKILRLGHIVLGTSDFTNASKSLIRDFNFVVSDFVEDRFAFLRAFPNPLHHSLAIGAAPENALHHINFMVPDIDDIGQAIHRMKAHKVKVAFGPGRHPPSGSVFFYFFDPDGITAEYSFGMEEFPEQGSREARMLEPVPASLDTWGAIADPMFGKGPAIEVAS